MNDEHMIYSLDELDTVADYLYQHMSDCQIFTFTGSLGAGKTTLVRALLRKCGITQSITSPTFTYVNVYENDVGKTFYHFDLYRINSVDEFVDAGFDEYLYQPNSRVFIEWPELIMPLLTRNVCHVALDYHDDKRSLNMTCFK